MLKERESAWNYAGLGTPLFSHRHFFPGPTMVGQPPQEGRSEPLLRYHCPESGSDQGLFPLSFGLRGDLTQKWAWLPEAVLSGCSSRKPPSCGHRKGPSFEGPDARQAANPPSQRAHLPLTTIHTAHSRGAGSIHFWELRQRYSWTHSHFALLILFMCLQEIRWSVLESLRGFPGGDLKMQKPRSLLLPSLSCFSLLLLPLLHP